MATFEEFLRAGKLGPLYLGMTHAEAIAGLGPPPNESVQREPKTLKYGGLQITFSRASGGASPRLVLAGLYFHAPAEAIPDPVRPTDFSANHDTTLNDMQAFCRRVELETTASSDGEEACLSLANGASISFVDQKLWSILVPLRAPAPPKKQIAVSIPEDAWQQLHTLARQSNRSVSEL